MDFRAREATWLSQIHTVFQDSNPIVGDTDAGNVKDLKIAIKLFLHKRIKLWWKRTSLEQYVSKKLIPRRLRIQIFPAYGMDNTPFSQKWEDICNSSSIAFMQLIIATNSIMLDELTHQIEEKDALGKLISLSEIENLKKELDGQFKNWEKEN